MRTYRLKTGEPYRTGFTVVEVLVAMTVMAVGMVAVFEALRMTNDASTRARDEFTARLLAERHMVSLMSRPPDQLQPASGKEGRFGWEERIQRSAVTQILELSVRVTWRFRGRPLEFELLSLREMGQP